MISLARVLSAEVVKLRRTLAFWMVFIAPLVVVLLNVAMLAQRSHMFARSKEDPWALLARSIFILWGFIMLPLFVTLESALLAGLEHGERQWQNLLALPVPRWTVFLTKLIVLGALIVAAHAVLFVGTIAGGLVAGALVPALRLAWPVSWWRVLDVTVWTMAASPLIVVVHHWVSLRWKSFTAALGFGICAVAGGFLITQSNSWWYWYPWSWPVRAAMEHASPIVLIAAAMALVAAIASCCDLSRREVM